MASSSLFSMFCSVSLLLRLGALISAGFQIIAGSKTGNMAMAIEEVDSTALLPFGSASGNFFRLPQCGGPRRTVVTAQNIGVCYGSRGDNLPNAREVVQLYKSNGIKKMRIYNPDVHILNALQGSNIEVVVGIPNNELQRLVNLSSATDWVQRNIQVYVPHVKFWYISVGHVVQPSDASARHVLPAIRSIYSAIAAANLQDQIKVSTAISTSLLGNSFPPSVASFTYQSRGFIEPIVSFLAKNGLPLLVNVHPYFTYIDNAQSVDLDYVLFTASSQAIFIRDGSLQYHNFFETIVDALYTALEKSGGANVSIVVSESGWPSSGGTAATVENAGTFYRNLISFVQNGTPKRPGRGIETFLFAMFDENLKFPEMEKYFGLFTADKKPKYQLSFS